MITVKNVRPHAVVIGSAGFAIAPDAVAEVDGADAGVRALLAAGALVPYERPVPSTPSAPPDVSARLDGAVQQAQTAADTAQRALEAVRALQSASDGADGTHSAALAAVAQRLTAAEEAVVSGRIERRAAIKSFGESFADLGERLNGANATFAAYVQEQVQTDAAQAQRLTALESRPAEDAAARDSARAADGKAQRAQQTASAAQTAAGKAQTTADGAAGKAEAAQRAAQDALNRAQEAERSAQGASEAAGRAQQTAQGAADAAARAQSLAESAVTSAQLEAAVAALGQQVRGLTASPNLVNHAASRVGRLASNTDGAERALAGYVLTDFVGVAAGARYALTVYPKAVSGGFVVWYRADRAFLSGQTLPPNTEHAALTAPAGAAWVRISAAVGGNQAAFSLFKVS